MGNSTKVAKAPLNIPTVLRILALHHFAFPEGKHGHESGKAFKMCSHVCKLLNRAPTYMSYPVNIPRHGQCDAGCASYVNASDILMHMCVGSGLGSG